MMSVDGAKAADPFFDHVAVVALGSNLGVSNLGGELGSSRAILEAALSRLGQSGLTVVKRSSWWRSAAWPDPTEPDYLNGVALVETALTPSEALGLLHRIEAEFGRERSEPNASRTLDLDLIAYGRTVADTGEVHLPHPRAPERLFVMGPLAEIAPDWRHPVTGERAADLAAGANVGRDARPE